MDTTHNKRKYVSYIKINGLPILPPLITPDKCRDIKYYKMQALKVEKQLDRNKLVRSETKHNNFHIIQQEVPELCNGICTKFDQFANKQTVPDSSLTNAASISMSPQLIHNIQSLQHIDYDIQKKDFMSDDQLYRIKQDSYVLPKTQLVRSNSYILENPSPALVEHIKKSNYANINKNWRSSENIATNLIKSPDNSSSAGNVESNALYCYNGKSHEDLSTTITDENYHFDTSGTNSELKNIMDNECLSHVPTEEHILKQFMDNNISKTLICALGKINCDNISSVELKKTTTELEALTSEPTMELKIFLNNMLTQMLNLVRKQSGYVNYNDINNDVESNVKYSNNEQTIDGESIFSNEFGELCDNPEKYSTPNGDKTCTLLNLENTAYFSADENIKHDGSSKKLFQTDSPEFKTCQNMLSNEEQRLKEEKAASVIGAAARGYIVRRLMQTEKVKNLIQTIKDALLCAMQLHTETIENIEESDVELHRRLLHQVSSACYSFHEIFFYATVQERMSIIAADRRKKLDRLTKAPAGSVHVNTSQQSLRSSFESRSSSNS